MSAEPESPVSQIVANYTIAPPSRKHKQLEIRSDDLEDESSEKMSATFTLSPPPSAKSIASFASQLEKELNDTSVTISVPISPLRTPVASESPKLEVSPTIEKIEKFNEIDAKKINSPLPQTRTLFDLERAPQKAESIEATTPSPEVTEPERRPSWRLKIAEQVANKVIFQTHMLVTRKWILVYLGVLLFLSIIILQYY